MSFGSEADMCSAKRHVRFTPESDIKSDGKASNAGPGARRRSYGGIFTQFAQAVRPAFDRRILAPPSPQPREIKIHRAHKQRVNFIERTNNESIMCGFELRTARAALG